MSIYVPTLTYVHELWVVTKGMRFWIQPAEMSFIYRVAGLSLRDRARSPDVRQELENRAASLCLERSQLRWFGHMIRMGASLWMFSGHVQLGGDPGVDPGLARRDYIS